MAQASPQALPLPAAAAKRRRGGGLGLGLSTAYLSVIVLLPIGAIVWKSTGDGADGFWQAISNRQAVSALELTLVASLLVAAVNAMAGTLVAWVLVRDSFRGKSVVNAVIDLPFALPTIVAGLTLLALYGPRSPIHVHLAYTRAAVVLALLFVTVPFVVRSVQPVLQEIDREMEEAAHSLGASPFTTFRRIVLPNLGPAILSGGALAFGKAVGEFGSLVLITGNIPFKTEVASVHVYGLVQSSATTAAAAVSVVLLAVSFLILVLADMLDRLGRRHERS